jgi:hypothetical protein
VNLTTRYQVSGPHVVNETIDGEVVLIDLQSGRYFCIRGLGVPIWNGICGGAMVGSLVSLVGPSPEVDHATLEGAVVDFLDELEREGLVRESHGEAPLAGVTEPPPGMDRRAAVPFERPVLEKYTDLADLLVMDPVHDVGSQGWPHPHPDR